MAKKEEVRQRRWFTPNKRADSFAKERKAKVHQRGEKEGKQLTEYEKGMRVFVDNKEIKTDILLGSLIGFKLEKGSHTIVIDYVPKGLIPGLLLSVIGIISTCFYLQTSKKKL